MEDCDDGINDPENSERAEGGRIVNGAFSFAQEEEDAIIFGVWMVLYNIGIGDEG